MPTLADLYAHPDHGSRTDAEIWAEMQQTEAALNPPPPPPAPRTIVAAIYQASRDGKSMTERLHLQDGTVLERAFAGSAERRQVGELLPE